MAVEHCVKALEERYSYAHLSSPPLGLLFHSVCKVRSHFIVML
jgi:hypothetical protein